MPCFFFSFLLCLFLLLLFLQLILFSNLYPFSNAQKGSSNLSSETYLKMLRMSWRTCLNSHSLFILSSFITLSLQLCASLSFTMTLYVFAPLKAKAAYTNVCMHVSILFFSILLLRRRWVNLLGRRREGMICSLGEILLSSAGSANSGKIHEELYFYFWCRLFHLRTIHCSMFRDLWEHNCLPIKQERRG